MKISLRLVAFLLIFSSNEAVFAQNKLVPGYYLSMEGDTVKGEFTNYSQWNKNPTQVEFFVLRSAEKMVLTPLNVQKFVIEGYDEYVSYSGTRLLNPIEDQILINEGFTISPADVGEKVVAFLRVVSKTTGGNLFMLYDTKRVNFFYQLPGDSIIELRYKKSIIANRITEMAEYRNQIGKLFAEKIEKNNLFFELSKLTYKEEPLASFFQVLFPGTQTAERKKKKAKGKWVISAGMIMNKVSISSESSNFTLPRNYKNSFSPIISIGYYSPIARKFEKYFLYPQLSLSSYKNKGEIKGEYAHTNTFQADLLIGAQISGGVNVINKEDFKLFFAGGFGGLIQIGGIMDPRGDQPPLTIFDDAAKYDLSGMTYIIEASTGIALNKKFLYSAGYRFPAPIGTFRYFVPRLSGFHLKVGYMFN